MPPANNLTPWRFLVVILVERPQDWPREDKAHRILAALRSLAGQPMGNTLVIIEPSPALVRRQ